MVKSSSNGCQEENEENKVAERSCCSRRGPLSRHHKVSMILRLSTANENRSEREGTTSVVPIHSPLILDSPKPIIETNRSVYLLFC